MRFIGNKEKLLDRIYQVIKVKNIEGNSFFDFFAGTANVGKFFKKLNYQVFSSDLLYLSYVLQRAYIVNNSEPTFNKLLNKLALSRLSVLTSPMEEVVGYLNEIEPVEGFIYNNYSPGGTLQLKTPRMFFTDENGKRIDAIRQQIERWRASDLLNEHEYYILLACLVETVPFYANISGVYAAFQKKWDPRALKRLVLRPITLLINKRENHAYNINSTMLLDKVNADILYIDPPYNQRQYAPNYHLLETIAKYDAPKIKGITGLRDYSEQRSNFCNAKKALQELSKIAKGANYKTLLLSYNSEGIMNQGDILSTLGEYGKVDLVEFDYLRFKSNSKGESNSKKIIKEQLYILKK